MRTLPKGLDFATWLVASRHGEPEHSTILGGGRLTPNSTVGSAAASGTHSSKTRHEVGQTDLVPSRRAA